VLLVVFPTPCCFYECIDCIVVERYEFQGSPSIDEGNARLHCVVKRQQS
jgi:hypothetical protein